MTQVDNKLVKANNIIESLKTELIQADSLMKNKDFEIFTLKSDMDKLNDKMAVKETENKSLRMMGFHVNNGFSPRNEQVDQVSPKITGKSITNVPIGAINQDMLRQMMIKNKAARKKKAQQKEKEEVKKEYGLNQSKERKCIFSK